MAKKVMFNTLQYAKTLNSAGVEHADTHSAALEQALTQNIYSIPDVDKMIRELSARSEHRILKVDRRIEKRLEKMWEIKWVNGLDH